MCIAASFKYFFKSQNVKLVYTISYEYAVVIYHRARKEQRNNRSQSMNTSFNQVNAPRSV